MVSNQLAETVKVDDLEKMMFSGVFDTIAENKEKTTLAFLTNERLNSPQKHLHKL
jgi:hypothetical protein